MGWNTLERSGDDPLLQGIEPAGYVYFVHSYAAAVADGTLATVATARHGRGGTRRNFRGVQFHPERSAAAGARVLRNFLAL